MNVLRQLSCGRFDLDGYALHCGDGIEILCGVKLSKNGVEENVWIRGRVEADSSGRYYFYNPSGPHIPLVVGLQARLPNE